MNKKRWLFVIVPILLVSVLYPLWRYYSYSGPDVGGRCHTGKLLNFTCLHPQIDDIIKRFHDRRHSLNPRDLRGHFSLMPGGNTDLYGSADMAYLLWITGELEERTTPRGRAEWIALIQSFQNPDTGLFDRLDKPEESVIHATAFATAALKLLGSGPLYPHRWADRFFSSPGAVARWLEAFGWNEVWSGSHNAGAAAAVIDAPHGTGLPHPWKKWVVVAFTERVDRRTGFWKRGILDRVNRKVTTIDLGGAAHFWWIYLHTDTPVPFPEKVITGILGLQKSSGLWGTRLFNGALPQGIDFDAINGMRIAWRYTSPAFRKKQREKIIGALDRYACAAHYHLAAGDSLTKLFTKTHKMVGTFNALAELDLFYRELTGERKLILVRPLRSSLDTAAWQ